MKKQSSIKGKFRIFKKKNSNKKRIGIREIISGSFIILALIAIGGAGTTSGIFTGVIGITASDTVINQLEDKIEKNLKDETSSYSLMIQTQLQQVASDINGIAQAVSNIFRDDYDFEYRKSYYHVDKLNAGTVLFNGTVLTSKIEFPNNIPPDAVYNPKLGLLASSEFSHYLIYRDSYYDMGENEYNLTGIYGVIINQTAQLDPIMKDVLLKNNHYSWIYMDFEIGIQRTFPWSGVDITVFGPHYYDYKTSEWYKDAKLKNGIPVWSAPYLDPYIGWIVTISQALYNGSEFIGVVGIDFTLNAISDTVGNIEVYESGYGFMIDDEGSIISHPEVDFDRDEEDPPNIQDEEPISDETLEDMTDSEDNFVKITDDKNKNYYLAYEQIPLTGYILGIIVPTEEVLEPIDELQQKILLNLITQIVILLIFLGLVLALALFIGIRIANSVVNPLEKLTKYALQLSTENIKKTTLEKSNILEKLDDIIVNKDEIAELTHSFKSLVKMIKEDALSEKSNKSDTMK